MASRVPQRIPTQKVLVLGKSGVGKSLLLLQYAAKENQPITMMPKTTIEVDFKKSSEFIGETEVQMQIWDTAGQEKFRPIIQAYFKNAKGAVLVFDLTDKQSLIDVQYWLRELRIQSGNDVVKILVGNKCDLLQDGDKQPDKQLIQDYCEDNDMEYVETSALQDTNVKDVFKSLAKKLLEKSILQASQISQQQQQTIINNNKDSNSQMTTSLKQKDSTQTSQTENNSSNNNNNNNPVKLSTNKKPKRSKDSGECC